MPRSKFHKPNPSTSVGCEMWRCNACGKELSYLRFNEQSGLLAKKLHFKKCVKPDDGVKTLIHIPMKIIGNGSRGSVIEDMRTIMTKTKEAIDKVK
jgi:hypothetical protein